MNWLNYLLQVNLYLVLFYGFYRLLLRSETFFNLNRGYLVASAALAFFIPLMQSDWVRSWFVTEQVSQTIFTLYDPQMMYIQASASQVHTMTMGEIIAFCYIVGIILGIARFGGNLVFLGQMMNRKTQGGDSKRAFSFFNVLFVSKELKNHSTIVKHEFVHIRQLHSADVLLFELIAIFNWFNPVVYLYKSSIKHIHEFIADEVASKNESSKAEYAMLLFQEQFGVQAIPLTNNFFNQSLLKLRIKMLHKTRSTQTALMKYGLIAPLFMLMIVVSSATLATKPMEKMEKMVKEISVQDAPLINDNTVIEDVVENNSSDPNVDLSKALVISPALVDEVRNYSKIDTGMVFMTVQEMAQFPGGMKAFSKYLEENLKYPAAAVKANHNGKVYIQFIVNIDGSATDLEVLKGTGFGCDEEAVRVLEATKWIPGKQNGKVVRSRYTIPISFQITDVARTLPAVLETNELSKTNNASDNLNRISEFKVIRLKSATKDGSPPLYIIDGMETTSESIKDIKDINPNSIESISILKDETATKMYGDKGKNGVIIITMKKKENKPIQETANSEVFNEVEQQAEYPGGMQAFGKYLAMTLKYPAAAQRANKSGKVYVQFIVNADGTATDFNVLKSAGFGFDEEALRVLVAVPKWTPGRQSGRIVRSRFTVPIAFQLEK